MLHEKWYAYQDFLGVWSVRVTGADGMPPIAVLLSEEVALHIVNIHNEWLTAGAAPIDLVLTGKGLRATKGPSKTVKRRLQRRRSADSRRMAVAND